MPNAFHPFSAEHLITVLTGSLVVAVLIWIAKTGEKNRYRIAALLAFLNFSAYPLSQAAWMLLDAPKSLDNFLPFHLCDVASITAGFALLTRRHLLATLTYFWGLAATIQALLTPAIGVGFPEAPFIMFFVQHFAIVAVALFLPIVDGWRPKNPWWRSPVEVYGWSIIYLIFALIVNRLLGTNFGFAAHPPENPSLIDHLGPWPWYLGAMLILALILYLLLALPFVRSRKPGK